MARKSPKPSDRPEDPAYGDARPSCGTIAGHVLYSATDSGQPAGQPASGALTVLDQGSYTLAEADCATVAV